MIGKIKKINLKEMIQMKKFFRRIKSGLKTFFSFPFILLGLVLRPEEEEDFSEKKKNSKIFLSIRKVN